MREHVIEQLRRRGVTLKDVGELVYTLQNQYHRDLTVENCTHAVHDILAKREVQFAFLTGIAIDVLAEEEGFPQPLQEIVRSDNPLYGVDEVLALGITNIYGSIGFTNFGFLDRQKPGVLGRLNKEEKEKGRCHTFLDDLLAGLAAAAAARLAHARADAAESMDNGKPKVSQDGTGPLAGVS